jgi:hypothetical protein
MKIRISLTIDNEYANRAVFGGDEEWPLVPGGAGVKDLPRATVEAMLADAKFNSDRQCQTIGPNDMPLPVYNAYRSLAKQLTKVLAAPAGAGA